MVIIYQNTSLDYFLVCVLLVPLLLCRGFKHINNSLTRYKLMFTGTFFSVANVIQQAGCPVPEYIKGFQKLLRYSLKFTWKFFSLCMYILTFTLVHYSSINATILEHFKVKTFLLNICEYDVFFPCQFFILEILNTQIF